MRAEFESQGLRLSAHVARPAAGQALASRPGLIVCHGFPNLADTGSSDETYTQLADRIAAEAGWTVLTFSFRGVGRSEGDFSLGGWLADLHAAIEHLGASGEVDGLWLAGASTGGSLAICAASEDPSVRGVAALSARADFVDWAGQPRRFLEHARAVGVVRDAGYPEDIEAWALELKQVRPLAVVAALAPRPLLLVQGAEDDAVPLADVEALADAHGSAEVRVLSGAGHALRHDPRAVAVLLGWLEGQAAQT
ncbi:alpha/beta hydrolase [soil metagenome]